MQVQVSRPLLLVNENFLETAGFDTGRRTRLYATSGSNLNKNAAGATCGVRKHKKRLLIFGQQAREQRALLIESTHTDAHEGMVRSFVSHSGDYSISFGV